MASVNKIELCGALISKTAFVDKECEAIILPHGLRDVLYVSDCFIGADVKARLEHSPNGLAGSWATVQTKQISGGATADSWGNEKYLDTNPKRPLSGSDPDYKNKHLKITTNFSGVDIIQHKLDATSPFNLSLWMKSDEVPATTYTPAQNEVYIDTKGNGQLLTMPGTAIGADRIIGTDKSWTFSWWEKYSTSYYNGANHYGFTTMNATVAPAAGKHGFYMNGVWGLSAPLMLFYEGTTNICSGAWAARNGTHAKAGVVQFSNAYTGVPNAGTTADYTTNGGTLSAVAAGNRDQNLKTIIDPTDGEWHHIVLTFKAAADPTVDNWATLSPEVAEGAAGLRYYVDGYECYQQTVSSTTAALDGSVPFVMDDFEYDIHSGYSWDGAYGTGQAGGLTTDKRYILQNAIFSEYMTQENVDKLYGASTPGALDGKPQQEYNLSLTGFVTNPCEGFFDFEELGAGHANIGDGSAGHTLNTIGNPSDTDSTNNEYKTQYDFNNKGSNVNIKYRNYGWYNWNRADSYMMQIADNSGDSATFIAENSDTTYSPILFRCGGKIEANPSENLKYHEKPPERFYGSKSGSVYYSTVNGPFAGMGTGTVKGTPNLKDAWSASMWFYHPSTGAGSVSPNNTFFICQAGGTTKFQLTLSRANATTLSTSIKYQYDGAAGLTTINFSNVTIAADTWYLVTFTKSETGAAVAPVAADFKFYLNKTGAISSSITGTTLPTVDKEFDATTGDSLLFYDWSDFNWRYDELSFWNKELSSGEIDALYDTPSDLSSHADVVSYYRCGDGTGTADSVETYHTKHYDRRGLAGNMHYLEDYYYQTGGGSALATLGTHDTTGGAGHPYRVATPETFGEGMTISLTDKVDSTAAQGSQWKVSGGELPHLLISFNGFENDAEQWIAYKCDQGAEVQRNISYDGAGTPTTEYVNLLDNSWHNLIINYKGVASDGDIAYLSPDLTGVAGHTQDGYEFHVAMDGQLTDNINSNRGFNAAKVVDLNGFVTLNMQDKHLKNVSDTYIPTTFFASGFLEALATDSKYAYQGYIDETSFHSDSWWKDTGNPHKMCDCPIESVWGDNAQRLTGGQAGSSTAYGFTPMDNAPSVPHDLMDPQSIMTKPGDWAYIEPFPSGMYRCDENMPGHTTKAKCDEDTTVGKQAHSDGATGHWTANGGGLEAYYRWGDVPTDCQNCVNEARGYTTGISDDENYTNVEDTLKRSANIEGSLDWRDLKLGITTAEKIYVEGSSGGGGAGSITYIDAINNCSATGNHVITHLNAPYLHHLRVVYTGDGACTAGQCITSLFYRKEK